MKIKVINLIGKHDCDKIYALYVSTLGDIWPADKQVFNETIFNERSSNYIVKNESRVVAFLSTQIIKQASSIACIFIDREYQRKGIGTKMVIEATKQLKQKGTKILSLGSGGYSYFWPGVPTNLEPAVKFFKKMGWIYSETSVDMVGQLTNYQTPEGVYQRIKNLGIKLDFVKGNQLDNLDKFERKNFPDWYSYFSETIKKNKLDDILLAVSTGNQILGSVLIDRNKRVWNRILGNKVGALGTLGVSEGARGQGVGLALAARGTEILRESGVEVCFLGWTWLVDWYGKLGYKVWREYQMSTKNI